MILRICAWCRWPLGVRRGRPGVTHTICRPCARRMQRCPSTSLSARLARAIEAGADAALWLTMIAGYLLAVTLLYLALTTRADAGETMEVVATAYSYRESSHRKWGDRNALGTSLKVRVQGLLQIAVDPRRIPLGSIVAVEGLGRRIATDTGGLIRGPKIDVHWQSVSEMNRWGKRRVEIEVVRRGWGSGTKAAQRETHRRAAARDVARRDAAQPPRREAMYCMALDSKGRGKS